jgi:hypothetical protein
LCGFELRHEHLMASFRSFDVIFVTTPSPAAATTRSTRATSCMSLKQFHSCRYRGPAAGRFAAVAHARLAARRYYATRWLAEMCPPSCIDIAQLFPISWPRGAVTYIGLSKNSD